MSVYSYVGSGKVYAQVGSGGYRWIGNSSGLSIAIREKTVELQNYDDPAGGVESSVSRIQGGEITLALHELSPANLALALYGENSSVNGGTVSNESHVAHHGCLTRLSGVSPTAVTVTVGGSSKTGYEVTPGGIYIPEGSDIADGATMAVSYTFAATDVIQTMIHSGVELSLIFDGINSAQDERPCVVELYRVRFSPTKERLYKGENFSKLELTGKLLRDDSKTGNGVSKYFKETLAQV